MLRGQAREEDSVVLIDMASPEAGNGCSYGSTAQASEVPSTPGAVFSMLILAKPTQPYPKYKKKKTGGNRLAFENL